MAVDPIISDLQYIMESSQELDILNFYQSFPITCKARVVGINRDIVSLTVQPPGSICLENQEKTIILCKGLPEALEAKVISFDLLNGLLMVSELTYVGSHFGERMIARVQPNEPITVDLEYEGQQIQGFLVDVSFNGVGIIVDGEPCQRGQLIQLGIPLPENRVSLPGKILNISITADQKSRLSVGFTRNVQEIGVIIRYIKDRRIEIMDEIERLYEHTYRLVRASSNPTPE
jgi:hypothetical protein